jgi:membrane associated rhomboid family serine protease
VGTTREPIFNIPTVVVAVLAVLAIIHATRVYLLSPEASELLICSLAFVPARYGYEVLVTCGREYGWALWTFVTYSLLHADLTHIGFNSIWLAVFGTAVARRFGAMRFLIFFALTAAGGAVAHLISNIGEPNPMIGASGAISGTMGAAARFAFQRNGPLDPWNPNRERAYGIPAEPLLVAFRNPQVLGFVGVWFAANLLFGLGSSAIIGDDQTIAWEAHVGGFLCGLLLFSLFDPVGTPTDIGGDQSEPLLH